MTKRMLVDATHPEETRIAIVDGTWLNDFDFERASKKQLKGNIYLAKVIRIEPSLQAAFVEYGGNRHGFLPFSEIHPDYYRIPMADRPHDEVEGEEAEEDEDAGEDTEIAASDDPAADRELAEEAAAEQAIAIDEEESATASDVMMSDVEPAPMPEMQPTMAAGIEQPAILPTTDEFAASPENDLGLITDFGNAAVVDSSLPPPRPVEIVGGEVAEQAIAEERRRYPPRHRYKIQEVVKRRQVMLIQVVKEERGNKGAALTTFLSLAGRYCVLMPNTERGGGVSRKITSHQDRRRMKEILDQLEIPEGMAVILRTAGMEQKPAEIQRDLEYLLRLWNGIREQTLQSTAPALIYEEANLIKRSMRDLYAYDVEEILVCGKQGFELARDFMQTIMPDQVEKIKLYEDPIPLFFRYNVEKQIDNLYNPTVQLRSGGYIVINPTEALVSIDVNSGRATRERHIEGTALKTNLEAAEEIARQLRLRDLAGLVVIDFIDMEDGRNNASVERRLKESMRSDRARLQIGHISPFGLLELSRQRLRPSLMEINFEKCPHCAGIGFVRSVDSAALSILRMIEEEGIRQGSAELVLHVPTKIALYILNQKRPALSEIEKRYGLQVLLHSDDTLVPPDFKLERVRAGERTGPAVNVDQIWAEADKEASSAPAGGMPNLSEGESAEGQEQGGRHQDGGRRRGRYGYGRGGRNRNQGGQGHQQNQQPYPQPQQAEGGSMSETDGNQVEAPVVIDDNIGNAAPPYQDQDTPGDGSPDQQRRGGRRRGRRGGRGRRSGGGQGGPGGNGANGGGNRPPREGGPYQPRHEGPREPRDWNRNNNYATAASAVEATMPGVIPASIHEIDTTPREPRQQTQPTHSHASLSPMESPRPMQSAPRTPIVSTPYEVVDQASDKPKGGWWKKLTGQ
jgi:ribonuclease E